MIGRNKQKSFTVLICRAHEYKRILFFGHVKNNKDGTEVFRWQCKLIRTKPTNCRLSIRSEGWNSCMPNNYEQCNNLRARTHFNTHSYECVTETCVRIKWKCNIVKKSRAPSNRFTLIKHWQRAIVCICVSTKHFYFLCLSFSFCRLTSRGVRRQFFFCVVFILSFALAFLPIQLVPSSSIPSCFVWTNLNSDYSINIEDTLTTKGKDRPAKQFVNADQLKNQETHSTNTKIKQNVIKCAKHCHHLPRFIHKCDRALRRQWVWKNWNMQNDIMRLKRTFKIVGGGGFVVSTSLPLDYLCNMHEIFKRNGKI